MVNLNVTIDFINLLHIKLIKFKFYDNLEPFL